VAPPGSRVSGLDDDVLPADRRASAAPVPLNTPAPTSASRRWQDTPVAMMTACPTIRTGTAGASRALVQEARNSLMAG